jgi:hypothetical protein
LPCLRWRSSYPWGVAGQAGKSAVRYAEQIHPQLPPMRLASRRGRLYTGPCPFCADGGEDRFHVWMEASGDRPAERFWCRVCNRGGLLRSLDQEERRSGGTEPARAPRSGLEHPQAQANPAHVPFYRQLYAATALWAHAWLLDPCHPDPRGYLHQRGVSDATISRYVLGVTLNDPESLVAYLRAECPETFPFAEEAGLLVRDDNGRLRTHWNLCGRLVFPYIAGGEVADLRTRRYGEGKGYRSLGPYEPRGVDAPFGWDSITPGTKTVIVAEAEFKALAALQAYHDGQLAYPTVGQPGLTVFREEWAQQLRARGVEEVVLCYDSQPRPSKNGIPTLASEELWSVRHGATCTAAGLRVRVARLPLRPGEAKAEMDEFIPRHGANAFEQLIATAPLLRDYHRSIGRSLLEQHNLPVPSDYPTRRPRPERIHEPQASYCAGQAPSEASALEATRAKIAALAEAHASYGEGFLVLAHPPGVGKGFNATLGLRQWLAQTPTGDDGSGYLVWTGLRKNQMEDQQGIELIPLVGRNEANCRKLAEAQVLVQKGYSVKDALCQRRCPHVNHCAYLRQFGQEGDFFAPIPLLRATGWWQRAGVVVLDEFDPASLLNLVQLDASGLAAMGRAHPAKPAIQTVLRWVAQVLATTLDRTLSGVLFLDELQTQAQKEGAELDAALVAALAELPPPEELNMLRGLPIGARLADYQALPPGHTAALLTQLANERHRQRAGRRFTSRIEARNGRLELLLRVEHLIAQLARPEQPKLILDATANAGLLRALFPTTPLQIEQPAIEMRARVVQVIGRDWAKSTLRRDDRETNAKFTRWVDDVACQIRPDRPTLVVCTLEWAEELRAALAARGHSNARVAHYGALRGSNAYRGHDVILAQVYHPNLEQLIREGRALFADDALPLEEEVVLAPRMLQDASGACWQVQVPTFADPRLAALLEQRREAELLQCALRGRPFDHPDVQITLLFSLPVPGLTPTEIREAAQGPESNGGRETVTKERLCAATQRLLGQGVRVIDVAMLAEAAQTSVVVTRKHWRHVAARLHLAMHTRRRAATMPRGGTRSVARMVLVRKGRVVPPQRPGRATEPDDQTPAMKDHARDHTPAIRLIRHRRPWRGPTRRRRVWLKGTLRKPSVRPRAGPGADEAPHGPAP